MADKHFECRACLKTFETEVTLFNLFQAWNELWQGTSNNIIAMDLGRLANIQLSQVDRHSKLICEPCLLKLQQANQFTEMVQDNDKQLRKRHKDIPVTTRDCNDTIWPKPINLDNMEVEIKQEIPSDDEYSAQYNTIDEDRSKELNLTDAEIKVEPEEIAAQPIQVTVDGSLSEDYFKVLGGVLTNGNVINHDEHAKCLESRVKTEPQSEEEEESGFELPLDCMLCTKVFKKLSGLKAHVLTQHSYKSVRRKVAGAASPQKNCLDKFVCAICHRSFVTLTDLMVHETCHNKAVCYGCGQKCETFQELTDHRSRCKALRISKKLTKPKTLEDAIRPHSRALQYDTMELEKRKSDEANNKTEPLSKKVKTKSEKIKDNTVESIGGKYKIKSNEIKDETEEVYSKKIEIELINDKTVESKSKVITNSEETTENHIKIKEEFELLLCSICNEEFSDTYYLKIHEEAHHTSTEVINADLKRMKTELINTLFDET